MTSRRRFVGCAALAGLGLSLSRCVTGRFGSPSEPWLPAPDFAEAGVVRYVSGLRPYRTSGFRLESERVGAKQVVHSYGYGGCGFTLSWGAGQLATELVAAAGAAAGSSVGVLGAGAVGLATARVLQEQGFRVRVYARDLSPHTVSDVAGAQWCPSILAPCASPADEARLERMLRIAYGRFTALAPRRYGVVRRDNFVPDGVHSEFQRIPADVLPPARFEARLPFAGVLRGGMVYPTLLIEPPVYLPAMTEDVRTHGGAFVIRDLAAPGELQALPEPVLVNCTGVGARALFGDAALVPTRGQLVHLRPQALPYLLVHEAGYIFPRSDAVVLGGTYEQGVADARPEVATGRLILARNRGFFLPAPGAVERGDFAIGAGRR